METMHESDLVAAVEAGSINPAKFGHQAHVRLAWTYLRRHPLPGAMTRLRAALQGLARRLGHPDRYHETVTLAFLFLIQERMARQGGGTDWAAFAAANADLLADGRAVLDRYYRPETLASPLAREVFLLPDR